MTHAPRSLPALLVFTFTFALGSADPGLAQVTTATFYGTVTDSTGAVIAGATATVTHFNHTNLSGLRTNINDRFFGQLLGTRGARVIQLGARLNF